LLFTFVLSRNKKIRQQTINERPDMKIETQLDPQTQRLTIKYDEQMREMFSTAAQIIAQISDPNAYGELAEKLNDDRDLARSAKLLSSLGEAKNRHIEVDSEEISGALSVVCWSIIQLAAAKRPVKPLRLVLVAMANLALVRLPSFSLPPASEVFGRRKMPTMIRQTYEAIRSWDEGVDPGFLVVSTANEMWIQLSEISHPNLNFQRLLDHLALESSLYRVALQTLADETK
jgi:hypothetical protein